MRSHTMWCSRLLEVIKKKHTHQRNYIHLSLYFKCSNASRKSMLSDQLFLSFQDDDDDNEEEEEEDGEGDGEGDGDGDGE